MLARKWYTDVVGIGGPTHRLPYFLSVEQETGSSAEGGWGLHGVSCWRGEKVHE